MTHNGCVSTLPDETLVCGSAVQAIVDRMQATIDEQAEEIKRLEDALVEERAIASHLEYMIDGASGTYGRSVFDALKTGAQDEYRGIAREQLRAGGVIR